MAKVLAGDNKALEPNLLDVAFGMCARSGDATLFEQLAAKFPGEPDPANSVRLKGRTCLL